MTMRPYQVCSGLHETRLLCFGGWDVADWAKQAAIVIPIDPFDGFPLDFVHRFPRPDLVDDLSFEHMEGTVAPVGPRKPRNG